MIYLARGVGGGVEWSESWAVRHWQVICGKAFHVPSRLLWSVCGSRISTRHHLADAHRGTAKLN